MKKIFIAVAVLLLNINAQSQDTTKTLQEVMVTANKFPAKTSLTGKVATIITREQIEKSGSRDLSQLLTEQSGMFVNGANSNPGKDKGIYLRGAKVDYTLILVDGVPLYDPSGIGSNFDIRLLSIDNIERIEILKGSQSTLYGSDAMAGVINVITKKAAQKPLSVSGTFDYGSYNTIRGNISLNGTKQKVNYNINYAVMKAAGINEATDTIKSYLHETDRDGYMQNNLSVKLGLTPNKNISIQPYFRFSSFSQDYDQGAFTDELDLSSVNKNIQAGVKNEINIGKLKLNILYNFNKNNRTYIDDSLKSRNGYDIYSKGTYNGIEQFADIFLFYPVSKAFKFTGGADFRSSNSDQSYHSIGYYGPFNSDLGRDSLKQHQFGVYGALVWNTQKGFNAELGGRLNNHSAYGNNFVFNFNPSYLLKEQWKIFGNISSAYKTPTLYQLYSEYGNKRLSPETALTLEGGLQYYDKRNKFNSRLIYYNRIAKDAITFFTDPNTFESYYINQDLQKDHGLEMEAGFSFGKNSSLNLNYAFVDGQITTKNFGKDTSYFNLIRRPKSTFGLNISGKINNHISYRAGLLSVGKRTDITYDAFYNAIMIDLKNYILLNVYTEYAFSKSKFKIFVDLRNLTNTKYAETYGFNVSGINAYLGFRFNY
jgi:vitamin B12 transporter